MDEPGAMTRAQAWAIQKVPFRLMSITLPECLRRLLYGRSGLAHPGVVDQAVDLAELGHREVDEGGAGVRVGDVGRQGPHRGALRRELPGDVIQALGPASRQHHPPAGRGDRAGEADAKAGSRARDDDDPAIEAECPQGIHRVLLGDSALWRRCSLTITRPRIMMLLSDR